VFSYGAHVGLYPWLLFLHVVAAFATVAAVVLFAALLVGTRGSATTGLPVRRVSSLANRLWNLGGGAVLVFGVWLVLYLEGYDLLDGWIVAALVLYLLASAAGGFINQAYQRAFAPDDGEQTETGLRATRMFASHVALYLSIAALVVVMIYKPGAA
jgi:uncharacterized membrane protein